MFGLPGLGSLFGGGGGSSSFESGGIGNSKSQNQNSTEEFSVGFDTGGGNASFNRDERSYSTTITGSNNTTTDYGAVSEALDLAYKGVELANLNVQQTNTASAGLLNGALSMVGKQQSEFTTALEKVKLGNSDSMLIVIGLAVAAVAAVAIYRKG